mmetsp:Transcript_14861/g.37640  ORF Transcript_14861/g.37640 Transcript_14861/m.37640 type:complete len:228 (+) Transcript_14861:439-1122(+)
MRLSPLTPVSRSHTHEGRSLYPASVISKCRSAPFLKMVEKWLFLKNTASSRSFISLCSAKSPSVVSWFDVVCRKSWISWYARSSEPPSRSPLPYSISERAAALEEEATSPFCCCRCSRASESRAAPRGAAYFSFPPFSLASAITPSSASASPVAAGESALPWTSSVDPSVPAPPPVDAFPSSTRAGGGARFSPSPSLASASASSCAALWLCVVSLTSQLMTCSTSWL